MLRCFFQALNREILHTKDKQEAEDLIRRWIEEILEDIPTLEKAEVRADAGYPDLLNLSFSRNTENLSLRTELGWREGGTQLRFSSLAHLGDSIRPLLAALK